MQTIRSDATEARNLLWDVVGGQLTLTEFGGAPPVAGGRWAIERVLGRGGFGLVCAATDLKLQRAIAIKLLPRGPEMEALLREARSLARLEHPSIVTVFEIDEGELVCGERSVGCGWIAMQLVQGETLDAWLRRRARRGSAIVDIIVGAGRALAHAHHSGILHRDLKPANIMVDGAGRARVIDFGLAVASATRGGELDSWRWGGELDAGGALATSSGVVRGTPSYMAPEAQAGDSRAESDQYALAVVAWEALAGTHPGRTGQVPERTRLRRMTGRRWARVEPVLRRAMSPIPLERYPSVDAFCDALVQATSRRSTAGVLVAATCLAGVAVVGVGAVTGVPGWPSFGAADNDVPRAASAEPDARCDGLVAWEGQWNLTTKVVWTEYSDQLDRIRPMRVDLSFDDSCAARIAMERFQPADHRGGDALLSETASAAPEAQPGGGWSVAYDISFAGDRETYGKPESYHFELLLGRASDDGSMLHGAFEKRQTGSGMVLRSGWVLARKRSTPTLAEVEAHVHPCLARCLVWCAGEQARATCREQQCRPYAQPLADPCGPPTTDFVVPLRARAERNHLLAREAFGAVNAGSDGDCEANAQRVAGQWWVWRATAPKPEQIELDIVPDRCHLRATVKGERTASLSGEMTARGAWYLARDADAAPDAETLVLVGTGPAFGIDLAEPGHALRAFRP